MNAPLLIDAPTPIRLTVRDLEVLHNAGALASYRRTELIDGVVTEMSPMGRLHSWANGELYVRLRFALQALESPLIVTAGGPTIAIPPHDAPQPDIVVCDPSDNPGYAELSEVRLVMEVSDATIRRDLTTKRILYAGAGIAEYWVVDVNARQVHQFWAVDNDTYGEARIVPLDGELRSATIPDLTIDGCGIL